MTEAWDRRIAHYRVPMILRDASFDGDPTDALKAAREYVDEDLAMGRALVLLGQTGTGKTYSALAVCRTREDHWSFWYFPAWCAAIVARYSSRTVSTSLRSETAIPLTS